MPYKKLKSCRIALALSVIILVSSCGSKTPPAPIETTTASVSLSETTSPVSGTDSDTSPTSSETQTSPTETEISTEVTSSSESEEIDVSDSEPATEPPAESSDTDTSEEADDSSDTLESTDISAPPVTVAPVTETTTTTAAPVVKHDPSPPIIKKVSSDGIDVFSCDKGTIDYSNASKGYISAIYTGKKKAAKLRLTCGGKEYVYTFEPDGKYHYFTLSAGSGDYSVKMFEQADGKLYSDVIEGSFKAQIVNDVEQYTYTNDYIFFDANSTCVARASEICAGCTTDIEKVAAVFKYVVENISYDYDLAATIKTWYVPNPDETLRKKTGVCFDYASLMAAMLRSQGVPTRMVFGYVRVAPNDIYHAWNEVYTEQTGWVTLEVLFKSSGFNLLDSTFYSTTDDKKWVADLMSNKHNYTNTYIY